MTHYHGEYGHEHDGGTRPHNHEDEKETDVPQADESETSTEHPATEEDTSHRPDDNSVESNDNATRKNNDADSGDQIGKVRNTGSDHDDGSGDGKDVSNSDPEPDQPEDKGDIGAVEVVTPIEMLRVDNRPTTGRRSFRRGRR